MRRASFFRTLSCLSLLALACACNTLKYVPENEALLRKNHIEVSEGDVSPRSLKSYVRQQPNSRMLGLFNLNLGIYNLSGPDTSRWINRTLRNMGEEPVIYDEEQAERSRRSMERYLFSKGYFESEVVRSTTVSRRRADVWYKADPNRPYIVSDFTYKSEESDVLDSLIRVAIANQPVRIGDNFDSKALDRVRTEIVTLARDEGYYALNKDHFAYQVDSTVGDHEVSVTLQVRPFTQVASGQAGRSGNHFQYRISKVYFLLDVPTNSFLRNDNRYALEDYDEQTDGDYHFVYRNRPFLREKTLLQNCFVEPGQWYNASAVDRTYRRFNALNGLKYVNIRFVEAVSENEDERSLDCYIVLTPSEDHLFTVDVEGTNTAGDLGVAGTVSYSHQNLLGAGERYNISLRGAYEALSNSFANDYIEYGGETSLDFPDFRMPFLSQEFRKQIDAGTSYKFSYDNMSRPEFLRTTAAASLEYNWHNDRVRNTLSPIDFAYVYMPWVDNDFRDKYLTGSSYLRYSYEDQFILRAVYGFLYSSLPQGLYTNRRNYYTLRVNVESAGNLLDLGYRQWGTPNSEGQYTIGNIPFSQYLKGELEYTRNIVLNGNTRVAFRGGLGLAYPYGNSKILPFEKRFYSGGANSVRGWSVRTLGPGTFKTQLKTIDFMNQSGDMKLDLNMEIRQRWAGVLEGAYFIDAGNIWTLRQYDNQPGGQFSFDTFYEQIACSVGLGLRFDFNFLLLRVDGGMKVYDPSGATTMEKWRIRHIDSWDDFALHLAIGYPF